MVVVVQHKDGTIKHHFVKGTVIVESIDKSHGKDHIYKGGFKETMIEKVARRSVYKYYNTSTDAVMAGSFRELIGNDYNFDRPTQLQQKAAAYDAANAQPQAEVITFDTPAPKPEIIDAEYKDIQNTVDTPSTDVVNQETVETVEENITEIEAQPVAEETTGEAPF
jgi:hypothetical protein